MKTLKLKKVKISKIGNPHILFGGAYEAHNAQNAHNPYDDDMYVSHPDNCGDTRLDGDCIPQTNGNTATLGNATDIVGVRNVDVGIRN
ncbi:hypothetical protein IMCC3317_31870 [Kordia antarctica]|uniref:Uncharacterized protein n=1 Tax=Kordia antarctica TaxID=1218801 RepID=A0A7L4ZPI5_9FLAO|nr:hypothetical protein [Kordia antarctica]QHI37804.1 hypothetical protein IMCC3317_31870 [Kordia antarctica]